jgi:hypothetical protein
MAVLHCTVHGGIINPGVAIDAATPDFEMKCRNLVYVFCLAVGALSATAACAERRVALVIGNSSYKSAPQLRNKISNSTAIGNLVKSIGFEVVISRTDLGVVDFKRAVREFLVTAETADIAVVYYAGCGVWLAVPTISFPSMRRLAAITIWKMKQLRLTASSGRSSRCAGCVPSGCVPEQSIPDEDPFRRYPIGYARWAWNNRG